MLQLEPANIISTVIRSSKVIFSVNAASGYANTMSYAGVEVSRELPEFLFSQSGVGKAERSVH